MDTNTLEKPAEPRVFYSRSSNLMVNVRSAQRVIDNGIVKQVDSKIIEFMPQGDGSGRYVTSDPEEIAALTLNPRVLTPAQYIKETTPADVRLALQEAETGRVIEENNRLVQQLQKLDADRALLEARLKSQTEAKAAESQQQKPK